MLVLKFKPVLYLAFQKKMRIYHYQKFCCTRLGKKDNALFILNKNMPNAEAPQEVYWGWEGAGKTLENVLATQER